MAQKAADIKKTSMSVAKALIPFAAGAAIAYVGEQVLARNVAGLGRLGQGGENQRSLVILLMGLAGVTLASKFIKKDKAKIATAMGVGVASVAVGPQLGRLTRKAADSVAGLLPASSGASPSADVIQMQQRQRVSGGTPRHIKLRSLSI